MRFFFVVKILIVFLFLFWIIKFANGWQIERHFIIILIKFIKGYKFLISPLLGQSCRYLPTCSEYSIEALKEFGLVKGTFMSLKRILSCHPIKFLGGGDGFDPVKKEVKAKK